MGAPSFGDVAAKVRVRRLRADRVGAGPEGATCGGCGNLRERRHNRTYFKCGLEPITGGPGTDIRRKDRACVDWTPTTPMNRLLP